MSKLMHNVRGRYVSHQLLEKFYADTAVRSLGLLTICPQVINLALHSSSSSSNVTQHGSLVSSTWPSSGLRLLPPCALCVNTSASMLRKWYSFNNLPPSRAKSRGWPTKLKLVSTSNRLTTWRVDLTESHVGVGAQSTLGARHFCPKIMYEKN